MTAVYLDDILVTGRSVAEHHTNLEQVLHRLQEAGRRLKREKCAFIQQSVTYLGHVLDADGIHPTAEKFTAIKEAPAPCNVTELRSYIGMLNYYHMFSET